ncbi:PRELI domain-containing protein 1, mitochondrial-like [Eriocheir sinensis]|uniref:PRELI domain-containing protein 1, mitochondrial-like n=1 Tax=Eriocheir sinensis TaxID=95602 RepID=UPI0021C86DD5|nr:PRELI domain-containing protein 1, mitochondrial-like [Eriocheir sinensis]
MRYTENTSIFKYPWEQVAQGIWQRYPNPESSHVLSEDTVVRKVVDGQLHSKRLLTKTNRMPKWGERIISARNVNVIEESVVDPHKREMCTYTRNVGLTKVMTCIEKVTYRPCPDNPQWTIADRKAWIDSKIFGLSYAIQTFGAERYKKNIQKTNVGFMYALNRLFPTAGASPDTSQSHHPSLEERKQRLKEAARETAKRAKELAQEKAGPIYAACEGVKS